MYLTRSQVAARLGRSIATVRLMESARRLNPNVGSRGQRVFDSREVDAEAARIERTGSALPRPDTDVDSDDETIETLRRRVSSQARRVSELEAHERHLATSHERFRADIIDAVDELVAVMEPRQRRAIQALERLLQLLE